MIGRILRDSPGQDAWHDNTIGCTAGCCVSQSECKGFITPFCICDIRFAVLQHLGHTR